MLGEYNGGFREGYASVADSKITTRPLEPGDEGWNESMLLYEEYFLYDDAMLILATPKGCSNIAWTFYDPDNDFNRVPVLIRTGTDSNGNITYFKGSIYTGEHLTLYVPESGLTGPKTYQLQLTIVKGGNTYTDNCGIVVYQRYDR
ncbi:hypothetical protein [uncultured Treponema sp.]|uniref:hypothetical protein n=1 Tax=uncultured Treponema sp. TaxID=162155 RepID=UPI0025D2294A|nr:hypothetical protein [uncultured Treponema sp.]